MTQYDPPPARGGVSHGPDFEAGDRDPEEIRIQIAQTRTEMSGTIDAIQQRLAPEVLTEQAKDLARDATDQAKTAAQEVLQDAVREVKEAAKEVTEHAVHEVKEAARDVTANVKEAAWDATIGRAEDAVSTAGETAKGVGAIVIDTIKQNPIPAALAGLSLFWLYKNRGGASTGASGTGSQGGAYRTSGAYRTTGTPQAYPIRTGYASQAERDAMARSAGSSFTPGAAMRHGPAAGDTDDDQGGIVSSTGQFVSDAAGAVGQMAGDLASTSGHLAGTASGTVVDAGSGLIDLIQRNPVPAALVGIGLGWLYINRSAPEPDLRAHSGSHYRYGPQAAGQVGASHAQDAEGSQGASHLVSRATEQAGDLASAAQERVGEMAGAVQEHVGEMAGSVMHGTKVAPGKVQRWIQERPMTAAAVAASLGAAAALWLPPTEIENDLMGSANDQLMGRAQQVASETLEKVQDVAQEVGSTVREEARSKGLTV